MYAFLCAHLCLWYWRAVWERAVCHLAANAPALPRHGLPNRWTETATMRKQSVHDIRTHAFTKPTTRHQSFGPLTTAGHHKTAPYLHMNECVKGGREPSFDKFLTRTVDHHGNSIYFKCTMCNLCYQALSVTSSLGSWELLSSCHISKKCSHSR